MGWVQWSGLQLFSGLIGFGIRERETGEFHTDWHACTYVNVCVCVCVRAWKRQLLKQNTRGFWDVSCALGNIIAESCSDALQKITHARTHTHRERLFGENVLEYDNNDSNADNLRQSCSPPSASPAISLVFHFTSPPSPFSLWNGIQIAQLRSQISSGDPEIPILHPKHCNDLYCKSQKTGKSRYVLHGFLRFGAGLFGPKGVGWLIS